METLEQEQETGSHDTASTRSIKSLDYLEVNGYEVLPEMTARVAALACSTFNDDTVYASISTDGDTGELSLYWLAAERTMEVTLIPGDNWFIFIRNGGPDYTEEGHGPLPEEELRRHFAEFSEFVFNANPNWRETLANTY